MTSQPVAKLPQCIVSGGQTGVDRAALETAIAVGIAHGGWCPQGRLAEDGLISTRYQLQETASAEYPERTRQNVLDSDGTLILYRQRLYGGTDLTRRFARKLQKPLLLVDLAADPLPDETLSWLATHRIRRLNVAGPRESSAPGIGQQAQTFLTRLFRCLQDPPHRGS